MKTEFYRMSIEQSLQELKSNAESGLTEEEAKSRLERDGPNRLQSQKQKPLILRILAQFKDFLVIILIAAAVISVVAGDGPKDAIIIVSILIINMIIGITQENKADNALRELKNMASPKAKVKRDGHVLKIDSDCVVAGDIVVLDAGDYIPADIRLIESTNLKVDESALTGESMAVRKNADAVFEEEVTLGDRVNSASMGTVVTYGRGVGLVCATGMKSEMGKIAAVLSETDDAVTPLQDKLNAMAKTLGIVCIITCAIIFLIGFLRQMELLEMLMISVSLAVAAVPEGVAIVATVILAIGVQKMVKSNAIVKKLRAVETLGSTTVICSDKTGTMTQNKMTVVKVFDTAREYEVSGTGYSADGEVVAVGEATAEGEVIAGGEATADGEVVAMSHVTADGEATAGGQPISDNIRLMSEIAMLCNDSIYDKIGEKIIGDPTEASMLVFGAKLRMDKDELNARHKRVREIPFDSDRKLMSTYNIKDGKIIMNTKGAPDAIIKRSNRVYLSGEIVAMTEDMRTSLLGRNEQFASQALRVLGFAYKEYENEDAIDDLEDNLIYVGMMCMIDPPRDEVRESVVQCHGAGIVVKMITGDHKTTAGAIAEKLGLMEHGDEVLDGNDLNNLTDEELREKVGSVNVYARVSPEHKVRIVTAIKETGNIVAMTGDGVNDAPSLKKADIGIAMGITGTDVSKEASDMILTDDNFVSIVGAVEQGRTIYGNIRKVTGYLLACNIGEILVILLAIVFGLPVPLIATQLLFVNLLTDAFPAFALGMEGKEPGIMNKAPRDPKEPIINKSMKGMVALRSVFLCVGSLGAFLFGLNLYDYETAISMCFFTLVATELLLSYASRTEAFTGFGRGAFANKILNISMGASMAVLIAVMYAPFLNTLFSTVPLTAAQFAVCAALVLAAVCGSEFSKQFRHL